MAILARPSIAALLAAIVLAMFNAAMTGPILMTDNDAMLRLVQVRDLLGGQNWFDMTQLRMGPAGGFEMHWSRLIDAPLALIILAGQAAGLSTPGAEAFAIWLWPVIVSFVAFLATFRMALALGGKAAMGLAAIMAVATFQLLGMFANGAIDHHNAQIALALVVLMAMSDPQPDARHGAIAGLALALMAGIGVETQVHVALGALAVAVLWLVSGAARRAFTIGFGSAFAAAMAVLFFGTIAPAFYARPICDAFSVSQALPGAVGGLALAGVAAYSAGETSIQRRIVLLALAGTAAVAAVLPFSLTCLRNPLADIDPLIYQFWLRHIEEAKPLAVMFAEDMTIPMAVIMPTVIALMICLGCLVTGRIRVAAALIGGALAVSLAMSLYQFRASMVAAHFAVPVLAFWAALVLQWAHGPGKWLVHRLAFVLMVFASLGHFWVFAVMASEPLRGVAAATPDKPTSASCEGPAFMAMLNGIAPGTMMAVPNLGPDILVSTHHRAVTGPYHRNTAGLIATINAHILPQVQARAAFEAMGATHLVWCPLLVEVGIFSKENGLAADLLAGRVPNWLRPAITADDKSYTIFEVIQ